MTADSRADTWAPLIDVSDVALPDLVAAVADQDVIRRCVQRLLDDLERGGALSAFQAAVSS